MIDQHFAEHFASEWIAAWNAHDLTRVLSHYADDFEMSSALVTALPVLTALPKHFITTISAPVRWTTLTPAI
jgi:ketosteroid isomerase-like protein